MITFELSRRLDMRFFQTVAAYDLQFGACGRYVLEGDNLYVLGYNNSLKLSITSGEISKAKPESEWDIETEAQLWFAQDANETLLINLICEAYRYYINMDESVTKDVIDALIEDTNNRLFDYDLRVMPGERGFGMYHESGACSFEDAVNLIMEYDENRMYNGGMIDLINEALYLRRADRMEEAAAKLEEVVRRADYTQAIYTDSMFLLAETYYFAGNYKRAEQLYYRCNMEFIEDENDFYVHLGHALLDERMKKYERQVRVYYRCMIDPEYADTHRQQFAAASSEIGDDYEEYDKTCLEMGKKKYEEYKKKLPENADDIDEVMLGLSVNSQDEKKEEIKNEVADNIEEESVDITIDEEEISTPSNNNKQTLKGKIKKLFVEISSWYN